MSHQAIADSLKSIQSFNTKARQYLCVVGKGSSQRLEVVNRNWFGRILMCLGLSSSSMKKVALYVSSNIDSLLLQSATDSNAKSSLTSLVGKITRFNGKHKQKISNLVAKINVAVLKMPAIVPAAPPKVVTPAVPPQTTTPPAPQPVIGSVLQPAKLTIKPVPVSGGTVPPPLPGVSSPMPKRPSLHEKMEEMIQTMRRTIKQRTATIAPSPKTKVAPLPAYQKTLPKTPASPTSSPRPTSPALPDDVEPSTTPALLDPAVEAEIAFFVDKFKKERSDPEDVRNMLHQFTAPFERLDTPFSVKEMAAFAMMINEMTPLEVATYADRADLDVFKIKEGTIHFPSVTLASAITSMSVDKLKALVHAISKSADWGNDLESVRDAYYKIGCLLPSQAKNEILEEIVKQQRCFDTVFSLPSKRYNEDEKEIQEAEIVIQQQLAECAIYSLLRHKPIPSDLDAKLEQCWDLAQGGICKTKQKAMDRRLTMDQQQELAIFLVKTFEAPVLWQDAFFLHSLLSDPKKAAELVTVAKSEDGKKALRALCTPAVLLAIAHI